MLVRETDDGLVDFEKVASTPMAVVVGTRDDNWCLAKAYICQDVMRYGSVSIPFGCDEVGAVRTPIAVLTGPCVPFQHSQRCVTEELNYREGFIPSSNRRVTNAPCRSWAQ